MNSLTIGQIVRSYPLINGEFDVFKIRALDGEVVVVSNVNELSEPEAWTRSSIELYEFHGRDTIYKIGDDVTAYGYKGKWTVLHFAQDYRSSTQAEWNVALLHENKKTRLFYPANCLKKA
jgi:hypothetical protein